RPPARAWRPHGGQHRVYRRPARAAGNGRRGPRQGMDEVSRVEQAFAAIDAANAADPRSEAGEPVELLYGRRMTAEQERLHPDASDALRVACRGQHVERWLLPRSEYPQGREGYLSWRREQGRRHAERVMGIMRDAGFGD